MIPDLPTSLHQIPADGEHLLDQEGAPKPYKDTVEGQVRDSVLAFLRAARLLYCAGRRADGWPSSFVVPFALVPAAHRRPVLYCRLEEGSEELASIRENPRVSATTYIATGFENRREAKGIQIQGLATISDDPLGSAALDQRGDGDGFDPVHIAEGQGVMIRIDALAAVNFDASGRPQWGFLDYSSPVGN